MRLGGKLNVNAAHGLALVMIPVTLMFPFISTANATMPQPAAPQPTIELNAVDLGGAEWYDGVELDSPWPAELAPDVDEGPAEEPVN